MNNKVSGYCGSLGIYELTNGITFRGFIDSTEEALKVIKEKNLNRFVVINYFTGRVVLNSEI